MSSSNLTGALVANLDDDPDAPDADWATATALGNTEVRTGFVTPSAAPVTGAGVEQEFRVLLRKDAAAGTDPTYSIELWETGGGAALATLASGVSLTSETGTVVSVTWDASLLGTADGSAVELRIVGTASVDRSVEVGAVEWDARVPADGSGLYFLRARYYDPATGRFIGRDPIEFAQRYAYAGNNPVAFTDPAGLAPGPSSKDDVKNTFETVYCWSFGFLSDDCNRDAATINAGNTWDNTRERISDIEAWEDELGYVDLNGTACAVLCVTGGVQLSPADGIHPYGGGGFGDLQASVSLSYAPGQKITPGFGCGYQVSIFNATAQVGVADLTWDQYSPYVEGGVTAGFTPFIIAQAATCYWVID